MHAIACDQFVGDAAARKIDAQHAIAHNKVMVIDGATVITGSFNFTKRAENANAENLLVIHDAGAHGRAMGFNYNGKLRCGELLLRPDGTAMPSLCLS